MWIYRTNATRPEELAPARVEARLALLRRRIAARYRACGSLTDPQLIALSQEVDRLVLRLLAAEARSRR